MPVRSENVGFDRAVGAEREDGGRSASAPPGFGAVTYADEEVRAESGIQAVSHVHAGRVQECLRRFDRPLPLRLREYTSLVAARLADHYLVPLLGDLEVIGFCGVSTESGEFYLERVDIRMGGTVFCLGTQQIHNEYGFTATMQERADRNGATGVYVQVLSRPGETTLPVGDEHPMGWFFG